MADSRSSQNNVARQRLIGVRGLYNLVSWVLVVVVLVLMIVDVISLLNYMIGVVLVFAGWCGGWLDGRLSS